MKKGKREKVKKTKDKKVNGQKKCGKGGTEVPRWGNV